MRRLSAAIEQCPRRCLLLLPLLAACRKPRRVSATAGSEDDGELRSIVHVADPKASVQLLRGFHALEGNAWRWTQGRFAVTLRPPVNGARDGGWLVVKLAVAESVLKKYPSVRLAANVNGAPVDGETYTKTGDYLYRR